MFNPFGWIFQNSPILRSPERTLHNEAFNEVTTLAERSQAS